MGAAALVAAPLALIAPSAHADPNRNVTICHATGNPDKFVVITIDAAAIFKQGHDTHQNDNDVIPPFAYTPENGQDPVTFPGQNWEDNWKTNGEGVATEKVDVADCTGEKPVPTTPTPSKSTPGKTPGKTPTKTGPVVQTDRVADTGSSSALGFLAGGALVAGAGALFLSRRRQGDHR